jgi:hypothetical protein
MFATEVMQATVQANCSTACVPPSWTVIMETTPNKPKQNQPIPDGETRHNPSLGSKPLSSRIRNPRLGKGPGVAHDSGDAWLRELITGLLGPDTPREQGPLTGCSTDDGSGSSARGQVSTAGTAPSTPALGPDAGGKADEALPSTPERELNARSRAKALREDAKLHSKATKGGHCRQPCAARYKRDRNIGFGRDQIVRQVSRAPT